MVCGFVCLNVLETGNSDMNALSELSVMQIVHMTLFSFKHKDNGNYVTAPLLFPPPFYFSSIYLFYPVSFKRSWVVCASLNAPVSAARQTLGHV